MSIGYVSCENADASHSKRDFKKDIHDFDQKPVAEVTGADKHAADVLKCDFKKDIHDFDQKPVAEVTGADKHAADVLKFNGSLSLGYKNGSIIYVKTSKADRVLAMM